MSDLIGRRLVLVVLALIAVLGAGLGGWALSSGSARRAPKGPPSNTHVLNPRRAYVLDADGGILVPVDLTTKTSGKPIKLSLVVAEDDIAVSPSGATIYVAGQTFSTLNPVIVPVSTTTGTVGSPISLSIPNGGPPLAIAIAPDGQTAYVLGSSSGRAPLLIPIDLAHKVVSTPIPLPTAGYLTVTIAPDSSTAYVSSHTLIRPIDLPTDEVGSAIELGGGSSGHIDLSPNGHKIYVTWRKSNGQNYLLAINLTTHNVSPIAMLPGLPDLVSVTPDNSMAYVTDESNSPAAPGGFLIPVDLTHDTTGRPIKLPFANIAGLAITADGQNAYVSGMSTSSVTRAGVVGVDLDSGTVGDVIPMPAGRQVGPGGIVFVP